MNGSVSNKDDTNEHYATQDVNRRTDNKGDESEYLQSVVNDSEAEDLQSVTVVNDSVSSSVPMDIVMNDRDVATQNMIVLKYPCDNFASLKMEDLELPITTNPEVYCMKPTRIKNRIEWVHQSSLEDTEKIPVNPRFRPDNDIAVISNNKRKEIERKSEVFSDTDGIQKEKYLNDTIIDFWMRWYVYCIDLYCCIKSDSNIFFYFNYIGLPEIPLKEVQRIVSLFLHPISPQNY